MESIHAVVISICRVFASFDGERRHISAIRSMFERSDRYLIKRADV
jgi:hypothetical protein